jgi:hypothetical protein
LWVLAIIEDAAKLDLVKEAAKRSYSKRLVLFYSLLGEQTDAESAFRLTKPGLVWFNFEKMNYYTGYGDYTQSYVNDFVNGIQKNKFFFAKLDRIPDFRQIDNS